MEAMNVFYPELYQFVARHKSNLTGSAREESSNIFPADNKDRSDREKALIILAIDTYKLADERAAAQSLLQDLFPRIRKLFYQFNMLMVSRGLSDLSINDLTIQQHIAAPTHFERFFAYTVLNEDVSDIEFNEFLDAYNPMQAEVVMNLIERLGFPHFMTKLSYQIHCLTSKQANLLIDVLSSVSSLFDVPIGEFNSSIESEINQASILIIKLLSRIHAKDRHDVASRLIDEMSSFDLAFELRDDIIDQHEHLKTGTWMLGAPEGLFTQEEGKDLNSSLSKILLERALREANGQPLYLSHPRLSYRLMLGI